MHTTIRRTAAVITTTGATGILVVLGALPAMAAGPVVNPSLPGGLEGKLNTLLGILGGIAIVACVAGILFCAIKLAISMRRGELGEHLAGLGGVLIACVLVGSAVSIVQFAI